MYGWFHIIELLANHDVTKFKEVLECPAYEVFMHLCYAEDKAIEDRKKAMQPQ